MTFDPPIIINCRDRLRPLLALVDWLQRAGHKRIVLLDNASTYEPLLEWLNFGGHGCMVVHLEGNCGAQALWRSKAAVLRLSGFNYGYGTDDIDLRRDWFVYTDPDCIPLADCPLDAVAYLHDLLESYPEVPKAGLGLYLGDIPFSNARLLEHECRLLQPNPPHWAGELEPDVFDSWIDTTFALYRPGSNWVLPAIRTGYPYLCRHDSPSWTGLPPTDEEQFYFDHAAPGPLFSGWKARPHG